MILQLNAMLLEYCLIGLVIFNSGMMYDINKYFVFLFTAMF